MNILLSTERTLAQTVAALHPRCIATAYAIGTAYRHLPYESARRSYIQLVTPTGIVRNNYYFFWDICIMPATEKLGCLRKKLSMLHVVHTLAYSVCQTIS